MSFSSFKEIVKSLTIEMVEKAMKEVKKEAKQSKQDSITDRMFPDRRNQVTQHSITARMGAVFEKAFNKFAKIGGALPLYDGDGEDIESIKCYLIMKLIHFFVFRWILFTALKTKLGLASILKKLRKLN